MGFLFFEIPASESREKGFSPCLELSGLPAPIFPSQEERGRTAGTRESWQLWSVTKTSVLFTLQQLASLFDTRNLPLHPIISEQGDFPVDTDGDASFVGGLYRDDDDLVEMAPCTITGA